MVQVRLFRPFSAPHLLACAAGIGPLRRRARPDEGARRARRAALRGRVVALGQDARRTDPPARCRASSAAGTVSAPRSSRPAMVGVLDELAGPAPRHFTVGITTTSAAPAWRTIRPSRHRDRATLRAVFFGLGADGTVGANKHTIKIVGADGVGVRPGVLRLRLEEVRLAHGVAPAVQPASRSDRATWCSRRSSSGASVRRFLDTIDVLGVAAPGATLLLNSPFGPERSGTGCPVRCSTVLDKRLDLHVIDAEPRRARRRSRRAHEHRPADLLLRAVAAHAAGRGAVRHQGTPSAGLRTAGRGRRGPERGGGQRALAHLHRVPLPAACHGQPHRCGRWCGPTRRRSSRRSLRRCWRGGATRCRSARCRWTAPSRAAPRAGRSAASRPTCRCGTRHLHPVRQLRHRCARTA
jgi:pyruvate-ferredoxin/flavodoxin oxidoreductase